MEGKGAEATATGRASGGYAMSAAAAASASASSAGDKSWWQWTHGKSGSVSSSSGDVGTMAASVYGYPPTGPIDTTNHSVPSEAPASAAVPAWGTMRWEKRTTRTGLLARDERGSSIAPSSRSFSSPKFTATSSSATLGSSMVRGTSAVSRKKLVQSSIRSARDVSVRKRFTASSVSGLHDFTLPPAAKEVRSTAAIAVVEQETHADIRWTLGPGKRKVVKKDKKVARTPSLQYPRSGLSGVAHTSQRPLRAWLDSSARSSDTSDDGDVAPGIDVHMLEEKPAQCLSPTSTASTVSSAASIASGSSFKLTDPVTTCARAILVDCYRERQYVQSSGMRKRTLEGRTKMEKGSDTLSWSYPRELSKSPDGSGFSCGSSSSDDELKEVSQLGKSDRDSDCKSIPEQERYRQLMLSAYDISSSPEAEIGSPLLEEKGLSAEMRYQLPLARGTANETDKECTICKTRYNIGDHICTLPCQHFFHYRCVDQWLCSHTSCPLCRWDVTADADTMEFNQKHQLTECSPSDREAFQRKMRSSCHTAGFRPVVPEVDQLHQRLATLRLQEESSELNDEQVKYLVCPTPQRPERK